MTIQTASLQYANRPKDERFPSLTALVENALHEKNLSAERTYNAKDLHVRPVSAAVDGTTAGPQTGLELVSTKGTAGMSHWAFGQLCRSLGAPAGYLRSIPAPLAADCVNHGLQTTYAGQTFNLLVRGGNGSAPLVRAATSESYGRLWDADLYGAIARNFGHDPAWTLPPTWSGEPAGAYRGDRDSFLILTNGGSIVSDPSAMGGGQPNVGGRDAHGMYRGLLIRNSETGACSVTVEQILYRYVCGNHMLWGAIVDKRYSRRHVGTRVLRDTVNEIHRIAYAWTSRSAAADEALIRSLVTTEIATTQAGVIDELRKLKIGKTDAEAMYARCEVAEPNLSPRSYWGLAQGATRLSQDSGYQDERYDLDRLAMTVLTAGRARVAA